MGLIKQSIPTKLLDENGLRLDGRKLDEMRSTKLEMGTLKRADGSAYIEQGKNKILVAVYGPRELHPHHLALPDRCLLRCVYRMASFSVEERKSPAPGRREIELSKVIRESIEPALFLEEYPRAGIDVYIQILQADGGTRCASITAASLALADAGIPMRDIVVACAAGKVEDQIVLDIDDVEDKYGSGDMPVAMMPRKNEITLLQLDGIFSQDEFQKAFELAQQGCKRLYEYQKTVIKEKYKTIREEVGGDEKKEKTKESGPEH
jgi:exosome complex component RRP41